MYLHFFDSKNVRHYHFESVDSDAIVKELDNSFFQGLQLVDASNFEDIELINCLLDTLVNNGKIDRLFKVYIVSFLRETKRNLITSETKLGKAYDEIEYLKEKLHELREDK